MAKLKAALLFLAVAATARAEWAIVSSDSEPGRGSISHRHVILENAGERADVDLAIFSSASCTLRVIDNREGQSLAETMASENCAAGVNGGYFDPNFAPIGLRIIDGKAIAPLQRARLLTGVLFASGHAVQIARVGEFSRRRRLDGAMQCGPFLVDLGSRVHGLNDSHSARRAFAATATGNRAALGVCSEVSLAQLSEILTTIRFSEDSRIQRALNLDGGSSTGFWFIRANGKPFSIAEQKTVRDFVGVVASASSR